MLEPFILTVALSILTEPAFTVVSRSPDGLTLESRTSPDTSLEELKVVGRSAATPRVLADLVWSQAPLAHEGTFLQRREVVNERGSERVERQMLVAPLIGRRDSLVTFKRHVAPDGIETISFALSSPARASADQSMQVLRGQWTFAPDDSGGTRVEFRTVSDPGGLPAFLVEGSNRELTVAMVRGLIRRGAGTGETR